MLLGITWLVPNDQSVAADVTFVVTFFHKKKRKKEKQKRKQRKTKSSNSKPEMDGITGQRALCSHKVDT